MISMCDPFSDDEDEKGVPQSYAELQRSERTFVQPDTDDPWNDAVHRAQDEALFDMMPAGYEDSKEEREKVLLTNPKDDNAMFAPRKEDIEDFLEASAMFQRQQRREMPNNYHLAGSRASHIWPEITSDEVEDQRVSYAPGYSEQDQADKLEAAMRRSRAEAVFERPPAVVKQ